MCLNISKVHTRIFSKRKKSGKMLIMRLVANLPIGQHSNNNNNNNNNINNNNNNNKKNHNNSDDNNNDDDSTFVAQQFSKNSPGTAWFQMMMMAT